MTALLWVVVAYWILALIQTICNLAFVKRIRPETLAREPFVSVIVPARDEERAVERTVRALLQQRYSAFEVIVVDDRSTDGTRAILKRIAAEDPRLVVVDGVEPPDGWLGKPWALYQGSRRAGGELLLFVDADIVYSGGALNATVAALQSTGVAMVCLFPNFEMHGVWELATLPQLTMMGFTHLPTWLAERLDVPLFAIGGGTGNLIRRTEYEAIGGHEALRGAVIDDVGLARMVRANGYRTLLVRAERFASVRMYQGLRETLRGFTKNAFSTIERSYLVGLLAVASSLLFNFFPFVAALTLSRLALAAVALIVVTRVVLFTAVGYPLWSALLLQPVQTLLWAWIILRSMWFTGVRRQVEWRGRRYDASRTRFGAER